MRLLSPGMLVFAAICGAVPLASAAEPALPVTLYNPYAEMSTAIDNAIKAEHDGNLAAARDELVRAYANAEKDAGPDIAARVRIQLCLLMHLGRLDERMHRDDQASKDYITGMGLRGIYQPKDFSNTVWLLQLQDLVYREGRDQAYVDLARWLPDELQKEGAADRVRFRIMVRLMSSWSRLNRTKEAAEEGGRAWALLPTLGVVEAGAEDAFCRDYAAVLRRLGDGKKADDVAAYAQALRGWQFQDDSPAAPPAETAAAPPGTTDAAVKITAPSNTPVVIPPDSKCHLTYPTSAVMLELSGQVRVRFEVGTSGLVQHSTIVDSSGYQVLDDATLTSMARCKFLPAMRNGVPMVSSFDAIYEWRLD